MMYSFEEREGMDGAVHSWVLHVCLTRFQEIFVAVPTELALECDKRMCWLGRTSDYLFIP